ncbi:MAG: iron complex transport system permease protein [Oleiphilaceae bacterium]|jgi:iron complex transport system permease protein
MPIMMNNDAILKNYRYAFYCLIAFISIFISLGYGAIDIHFSELYQWLCSLIGFDSSADAIHVRIVEELRLPRMILAFLTGAGLSLSGAVLQMVTRNPLADPYLFGISSGASFGAVLVIATLSGSSTFLVEYGLLQLGITGGAFVGSTLSVILVLAFAGNGMQIERMLLAGVAVSFMFASATSLVLYHIDAQAVASLLFWTMGSFTRANWDNLYLPIVIVIICLAIFLGFSRQMRTALAGDESAQALGVDIHKLRINMLLLSSLMTATLVANTGGIGFIGLMIPHLVRRVFQHYQRYFLWSCMIFGGCFMVWIDVLARTLMDESELPIGVITAAIGSIFFLLVLKQRRS